MSAVIKTITDKKTGLVLHYTEAEFTKQRDMLLVCWQKAKATLESAKAEEARLRQSCVDFMFDQDKQKGTERIELGGGYQAKAVKSINYGFIKNPKTEKTDKAAIEAALQKIEAEGPAGELIAERLIKWTPDLSLTEYNQLKPEHKVIIDTVIITTPGMPTLEIIPPKEKK